MSYFYEYKLKIQQALDNIDAESIEVFKNRLCDFYSTKRPILVCGNGGSAAISEHLSCDHTKGIGMDTHLSPFLISLPSNVSITTAIANDIGYDHVFSKQIEWYPRNMSAVFVISSSGNSPNIINALKAARAKNYVTFAMVGFDGGAVVDEDLADYIIHVKSNNYGVVEDCHQIIMHCIAQDLRISNTDLDTLKL